MDTPAPVLPEYKGACIANAVAELRGRRAEPAAWLPGPAIGAEQVVLLVLDGLGWEQLQERRADAPTLAAMEGHAITSVAPTTTATALTSITTGVPPAAHDVLGYRLRVGGTDVLNVLRWRTAAGDARELVPPATFQRRPAFGGDPVPVVTRAEFNQTGFTMAHLGGTRLYGWRMASTLGVTVGRLLSAGEPFVYAYYDGIDKVAHEHGFGAFYDAELRAVDALVADLAARLPPGAALVVTADHGQVEVGDAVIDLDPQLLGLTSLVSGEGRFRWLHATSGTRERLIDLARRLYGDVAWVHTLAELESDGWFGGPLSDIGRGRLGDVALVPHAKVAFSDPKDTGERTLRCRHGSMTAAEMLVPFVAVRA